MLPWNQLKRVDGRTIFRKVYSDLAEGLSVAPTYPEKRYGIEKLKALCVTVFEETADPTDVEV